MHFRNVARAAALSVALAVSAAPALAQGDPTIEMLQPKARAAAMKMDANKDGMVSRAEFMQMVEAKWNEMDKQKKGMLTPDDVSRIMMHLAGVGQQ